MTVMIPLTRGYEAIVDDDDAERVLAFKWRALVARTLHKTRVCAMTNIPGSNPPRAVLMHRFIMGDPPGIEVDHINNNAIDNRRANLRTATRSQNQANCRARGPKSGLIGVSKMGRLYYGRVTKDGKWSLTKGFSDPIEAAIARDKMAFEVFHEFAKLNFPIGTEYY